MIFDQAILIKQQLDDLEARHGIRVPFSVVPLQTGATDVQIQADGECRTFDLQGGLTDERQKQIEEWFLAVCDPRGEAWVRSLPSPQK